MHILLREVEAPSCHNGWKLWVGLWGKKLLLNPGLSPNWLGSSLKFHFWTRDKHVFECWSCTQCLQLLAELCSPHFFGILSRTQKGHLQFLGPVAAGFCSEIWTIIPLTRAYMTGWWFQPLSKILVHGKDYFIYYGKKMCETTNQLGNGWVAGEWSNPENS